MKNFDAESNTQTYFQIAIGFSETFKNILLYKIQNAKIIIRNLFIIYIVEF